MGVMFGLQHGLRVGFVRRKGVYAEVGRSDAKQHEFWLDPPHFVSLVDMTRMRLVFSSQLVGVKVPVRVSKESDKAAVHWLLIATRCNITV